MTDKYLGLLDFILPILSNKYSQGGHLSALVEDYKKKFQIEVSNSEREHFKKLYEYEYFNTRGIDTIIITPEAKEIIDEYKTLSNFFNNQYQQTIEEKEEQEEQKKLHLENLKFQNDNLKLQNEKLDYQKTLRLKESEISELTRTNLKLQNRQLKRYIGYSIISFTSGLIVANYKFIISIMKLLFDKLF